MRPFTISIDPRVLEELKQLAAATGMSASQLIREVLEDFVKPVPETCLTGCARPQLPGTGLCAGCSGLEDGYGERE